MNSNVLSVCVCVVCVSVYGRETVGQIKPQSFPLSLSASLVRHQQEKGREQAEKEKETSR